MVHAHQGRPKGTSGSNPKDVSEVGSTIQQYRMLRDAHPPRAPRGRGAHGTPHGNRMIRNFGINVKKMKNNQFTHLNRLGVSRARKKRNALLPGRNLDGRIALRHPPRHALPHINNGRIALRAAGSIGRKVRF